MKTQPEMSTEVAPVFFSSAKSPTGSLFDSTSLIAMLGVAATGQSFAAPLVEEIVVTKGPVASGQRPYVVAA